MTKLFFKNYLLVLLVLLLLPLSQSAYGQTQSLEGMQNQDLLRLTTRLNPTGPVFKGQAVELIVEISTLNRFAGQSQVGEFHLPNAMVYRNKAFNKVFIDQVDGKNWIVQQIRLLIIPQQAGEIYLPAIPVSVTVVDKADKPVTGNLYSTPITANVVVPNGLEDGKPYLVSDNIEIIEQLTGQKDVYQVGDAITHTITIKAEGLPANMLPKITAKEVQGIATYEKQAASEEQVLRDTLLSTRTETFIYTIEEAGRYQLAIDPIIQINATNQQRKLQKFTVLDIQTTASRFTFDKSLTWLSKNWRYITGFLIAGGILIGLLWQLSRATQLKNVYQQYQLAKQLKQSLLRAWRVEDYPYILHVLYKIMEQNPRQAQNVRLKQALSTQADLLNYLEQITNLAYGDKTAQPLQKQQLLKLLKFLQAKPKTLVLRPRKISLTLNPR